MPFTHVHMLVSFGANKPIIYLKILQIFQNKTLKTMKNVP
jgi:hypothetical protein